MFKGILGYSKTVAEFCKNQEILSLWCPLLKYHIERWVHITIFKIGGATYGGLLVLEQVLRKKVHENKTFPQ